MHIQGGLCLGAGFGGCSGLLHPDPAETDARVGKYSADWLGHVFRRSGFLLPDACVAAAAVRKCQSICRPGGYCADRYGVCVCTVSDGDKYDRSGERKYDRLSGTAGGYDYDGGMSAHCVRSDGHHRLCLYYGDGFYPGKKIKAESLALK